jgi:hypothetical protein
MDRDASPASPKVRLGLKYVRGVWSPAPAFLSARWGDRIKAGDAEARGLITKGKLTPHARCVAGAVAGHHCALQPVEDADVTTGKTALQPPG